VVQHVWLAGPEGRGESGLKPVATPGLSEGAVHDDHTKALAEFSGRLNYRQAAG